MCYAGFVFFRTAPQLVALSALHGVAQVPLGGPAIILDASHYIPVVFLYNNLYTKYNGGRLNERLARGYAQGMLAPCFNLGTIRVWGDAVGPYMQAWSFLCLITPLCSYLYGGLYGGCMREHI